jgi:tetratricopeptide (TPR) repeat protein
LRALYTADEEAYDLYLKALHAAPLRVPAASMKDLLKRSDYLQQALARDPGFALAHIAVAETQWAFGAGVYLPARTAFEKEKEAALRALELDESLGAAYMHVALAVWNLSWDYRSADKNFRRAIELGAQLAHGRYALFLIQNGRTAEAVTQARSALELDPASEYTLSVVSAVNAFAGDLERALEQARRASELAGMPTFFVPFVLVRKGRYDQALIEFNKIGPYPAVRGHAAYALARLGRTDEARRTLRELEVMAGLEGTGAYEIAFIHGALGEKDEAFRWLDKAYEQRDPGLTYIKIDHTLDPLRSDPRFRELQRRMGLSP